MAKDLNFIKNAREKWEALCTSSGNRMAVKINRVKSGPLIVYGSIEDMENTIIHDFGPGADQDLMFEIDTPADVKLTLVSHSEVTAAKITGV